VAFDEYGMWAKAIGGSERHGGMNSEFPGGVGGGRDDTALISFSTNDDRLSDERGVE